MLLVRNCGDRRRFVHLENVVVKGNGYENEIIYDVQIKFVQAPIAKRIDYEIYYATTQHPDAKENYSIFVD